jgi:hypothetical protein
MLRYDHTQRGTVVRWALLGGAAVSAVLSYIVPPPPGVLVVLVVVLAVAAYLFSAMTVQIDDRALRWIFGPGMIQKAVPLAEIRRAEATRTRWYEGWGIHKTRRGWLYNVSGYDVVLVTRRDGSQFLLGTDEPARLRDAINRAVSG